MDGIVKTYEDLRRSVKIQGLMRIEKRFRILDRIRIDGYT